MSIFENLLQLFRKQTIEKTSLNFIVIHHFRRIARASTVRMLVLHDNGAICGHAVQAAHTAPLDSSDRTVKLLHGESSEQVSKANAASSHSRVCLDGKNA